jgi:hypothetical protein
LRILALPGSVSIKSEAFAMELTFISHRFLMRRLPEV